MRKSCPPPPSVFSRSYRNRRIISSKSFVLGLSIIFSLVIVGCESDSLIEDTQSLDTVHSDVEISARSVQDVVFPTTDIPVEEGILRFESKDMFHSLNDGTALLSDSLYKLWAKDVGFKSLRLSYIKANEAFDVEGMCNGCLEEVSPLVTIHTDGEPILLDHSVPLGGLLSEEGFVQIEDRIYYLELRLNISVADSDLSVLRVAVQNRDFSSDQIDILMDVRPESGSLSARAATRTIPCGDNTLTFYEIPRFKHDNGESKKRNKRWQRVHWRFSNTVIGGYDARDVTTKWWTESRSYKKSDTNVYRTNHYFAAQMVTYRVDGSNYLRTFYPLTEYEGQHTKDVEIPIQRTTGISERRYEGFYRYVDDMFPYTRTSHQGMGSSHYALMFCQ